MSGHTPGPWRSERTPASAYFDWTVMAASGKGRTMQIGIDTDNTEADARLIAAAPDLLQALQSALERPLRVEGDTWWTEVRAAVAKATGEQA